LHELKRFWVPLAILPRPLSAQLKKAAAASSAWLGLDPRSRTLAIAVAASLVLHGVVLSIRFQFPEVKRADALAPLEVVIVNSKTRSAPAKAEVLAQSRLDGGGNTDQRRRVRTPLPALAEDRPGNDVIEARQRVRELEALQQQLLGQLQAPVEAPVPAPLQTAPAPAPLQAAPAPAPLQTAPAPAPLQTAPAPAPPETAPAPTPAEPDRQAHASDLRTSALAMVRSLEGQVSRQLDQYNRRPKKTFIGARAAEFRFAQYVEDWRLKIERVGNLNYPESARGRLYGSLRLSVSINADGTLASLELERSSGHDILDRAAERIVRMSAPFANFPSNIRRDTDILVITRTWHFAPGDRVFSE
jgi:periplasmic protein TonB